MKLTVIGGGGVRSMFLAKSIAQRAEELHIDELVFMDNDPEKLRIYGGLAAHVARMLCPTMKFTLTSSAEEAVTDADYVITTIRVGGDATRVRDERLALIWVFSVRKRPALPAFRSPCARSLRWLNTAS